MFHQTVKVKQWSISCRAALLAGVHVLRSCDGAESDGANVMVMIGSIGIAITGEDLVSGILRENCQQCITRLLP